MKQIQDIGSRFQAIKSSGKNPTNGGKSLESRIMWHGQTQLEKSDKKFKKFDQLVSVFTTIKLKQEFLATNYKTFIWSVQLLKSCLFPFFNLFLLQKFRRKLVSCSLFDHLWPTVGWRRAGMDKTWKWNCSTPAAIRRSRRANWTSGLIIINLRYDEWEKWKNI